MRYFTAAVIVISSYSSLPPVILANPELAWNVDDVLTAPLFAIGHRGYGANSDVLPEPIENSKESVRRAYDEGIRIVEVDVNLSLDGKLVVTHDNFLPEDFTCINALTYDEIRAIKPETYQLHQILQEARDEAHNAPAVSGQIFVEIKTPTPLCDPFDEESKVLVELVVEEIRQAGLEEQVIIESFSPEIILFAQEYDPEIRRALVVDALQLLTPQEIEALTGFPVTPLEDKDVLGLTWAEIGLIFRGVGYVGGIPQIAVTALTLDVTCIVLDKRILLEVAQAIGIGIVQAFKSHDFCVTAYTAENANEWDLLQALGLDGIFTDDIPYGVANQSY